MSAALLTGCTGDGTGARAARQQRLATTSGRAAAADTVPANSAVDTARPTPSLSAASIRDIVASRALVGRRVQVTGRCLGPGSEHALGQPPRSRHEWQLESDGVAVFVIGPPPRGCSGSAMRSLTITALVAEDTLPPIGDLPPAPRRFLVFAGEEAR